MVPPLWANSNTVLGRIQDPAYIPSIDQPALFPWQINTCRSLVKPQSLARGWLL